jgi:hypothetical protein
MSSYDPNTSPVTTTWLQTDEAERIELVSAYHRRKNITLPDAKLHAVIHVVVENQIALGEEIVIETLARLQREGLGRHDALHAIGSVLAENLYELMQEDRDAADEPYRMYLQRLEKLTASSWRTG